MAAPNPNPLIRHLPVGAATVVALIAVAAFLLMPTGVLEQMVWRTGVAALIPAAEPPLGSTARHVLAIAFAAVGGAVTWSALFLLVGPGGLIAPRSRKAGDVPSVRRADAHPDAPPRRPMTAADLGTPMMDVHAVTADEPERPIPRDLDQPLAAFDPHAILPVPMEPVRPVAPLMTVADPRPPVIASGAIVEDSPLEEDIEQDTVQDQVAPEAESPAIEQVPVFATQAAAITAATLSWTSDRSGTPIGPVPTSVPTLVPTRIVDEPATGRPDAQPSIESLLRRLEQGNLRRRLLRTG